MGHFDNEKKQAAAIVAQYDQFMPMVRQNGAESTATLRAFIGKVEQHEHELAEIARVAHDRIRYIDGVEKNVEMLEGLLKKAQAMNDIQAAPILSGKTWGNLLDYEFNKSHPPKPQLVSSVERAIQSEVKRGQHIISEQSKSTLEWKKNAEHHVAACEKAKAAVAGVAL